MTRQTTAFEQRDLSSLPQLLPAELLDLRQWVVWKLEERKGDLTKVPYNSHTGRRASSKKPSTWATLEEALTAYSTGRYNGIGFMFANGFCGIDLDKCRDAITGEIQDWALAVVEKLDSYSEISPSLTGVHILTKAKLPGKGVNRSVNGHKIEVYDSGRFFTITGDRLEGTPKTVNERQVEVTALYEFVLEATGNTMQTKPIEGNRPAFTSALDDSRVLELATRLNGAKFAKLLAGDTGDYDADESRADMAFVGILSFYSPDDEQLLRLWRGSGLYRAKLEREDYVRRTIEKARGSQTAAYTGSSPYAWPGTGGAIGSQDATLKEEPEADLSDCEEVEDVDPPISSDPKREKYLRQMARNSGKMMETFAVILRLLEFEKNHARLLAALLAIGGDRLCPFRAYQASLRERYAEGGGASGEDTVRRDIRKLLEEQEALGVSIISYTPGSKDFETGKGYPCTFQNHLLRYALQAVDLWLDRLNEAEGRGEKLKPKDKRLLLEAACAQVVSQIPRFEPTPGGPKAKGKKARTIRDLEARLQSSENALIEHMLSEGWSQSKIETELDEIERYRRERVSQAFRITVRPRPEPGRDSAGWTN